MRDARQVFWGITTALISIALLFGSFMLSLVEGSRRLPTPTLPPPTLPTPTMPPIPTLNWQPSPSLSDSPTTLSPTWTLTLPSTPTNCPLPPGWLPYILLSGDTLDGLALRYKKTSAEISQGNCLVTDSLLPGQVVFLPPMPTITSVPCGAPHTWVIYIVQHGDTLYHLSQIYGIPFMDIQRANCLPSIIIHIGQPLYVPPWATTTPLPPFPGLSTPTSILPSDTPSAVWIDTPTETASATTTTEIITPTDADAATATP